MHGVLLLSTVTAAIAGYMAYRGSGEWWKGFATATVVWGSVTVAPVIALAGIGTPLGDVRAYFRALGIPIMYGANILMLGWLVWLRFRRD